MSVKKADLYNREYKEKKGGVKMAHEILSIKLYELDKKFARLQSRIQLSETERPEQIKEDLKTMKREYRENKQILHNKMNFSRSQKVKSIACAYDRVEAIIEDMQGEIRNALSENWEDEKSVEELILLAEYTLDFAMQAAEAALLISTEAILAQKEQEQKEQEQQEQKRKKQEQKIQEQKE